MYMPDLSLAQYRIQVGKSGTVALFKVCEIKYLPTDDPYRNVLHELSIEGDHRNVFMVNSDGLPIWRVQDYELPFSSDCFVGIRGVDMPSYSYVDGSCDYIDDSYDFVLGVTVNGFTFHISLKDGTLSERSWSKS